MAVLALPGLGLAHLCGAARLTAYATRQDHNTVVTVINKDVNRDASVNISGIAVKQASVTRRTGPVIAATSGASLGGTTIAADGTWPSPKADTVRITGGKTFVDVPAGSAALIRLHD
ncbi:MAG: hypothetical protein NTX21_06335 [Alphaproteobacteria bacterium]|nr:hypothetical protein [Alphaproteobacteria bacterium]